MTTARPARRPYSAPRRALQAQQTRAVVLTAARELFAERGWAGTGMRDVAKAAGVSVETVYATLGPKVAVFTAALDGAVVGDDEPVPLNQRPAFRDLGEGTLAERVEKGAALVLDILQRVNGLQQALREGARAEPVLAEALRAADRNRLESNAEALQLVLGRTVEADELDVFWAQTSPEVYEALTERRGWTGERYAAWVARLALDMAQDAVPK